MKIIIKLIIIPCKFQHFNNSSIVCCFRYKMDLLKSSEIITYWEYYSRFYFRNVQLRNQFQDAKSFTAVFIAFS